jgi:hypothetical protein
LTRTYKIAYAQAFQPPLQAARHGVSAASSGRAPQRFSRLFRPGATSPPSESRRLHRVTEGTADCYGNEHQRGGASEWKLLRDVTALCQACAAQVRGGSEMEAPTRSNSLCANAHSKVTAAQGGASAWKLLRDVARPNGQVSKRQSNSGIAG